LFINFLKPSGYFMYHLAEQLRILHNTRGPSTVPPTHITHEIL